MEISTCEPNAAAGLLQAGVTSFLFIIFFQSIGPGPKLDWFIFTWNLFITPVIFYSQVNNKIAVKPDHK